MTWKTDDRFSDDTVVHAFAVTVTAPADAYYEGDMRAEIQRAIAKVVNGKVDVRWDHS